MKRLMRWAVAPVAACVLMGPAAWAATVTTYNDEASFLAALGPQAQRFNADALASGTLITSQVPGITFSSANSALAGSPAKRVRARPSVERSAGSPNRARASG